MGTLGDLVMAIPMKRWLLASKRLGLTSSEIMDEAAASMVVAANEKAGQADGNFDQYARFLEMGMSAMSDYLDLDAGDDDADKSDEPVPG